MEEQIIRPTKQNYKLGKCPHYNSNDYSRDNLSPEDDYIKCSCNCNNCNKSFNEFFGLDEVSFDILEEATYRTNKLTQCDKRVLLRALDLLVETENDTNDYSNIFNILNGLTKEYKI